MRAALVPAFILAGATRKQSTGCVLHAVLRF